MLRFVFVEDDWALVRMDLEAKAGSWEMDVDRGLGDKWRAGMWMVKKRWIQVMSGWLTQ